MSSASLGALAYGLAAWGESRAVNVFPVQLTAAVLAFTLGLLVLARGSGTARRFTAFLASMGVIAGGVWLGAMGLLYVLWPK